MKQFCRSDTDVSLDAAELDFLEMAIARKFATMKVLGIESKNISLNILKLSLVMECALSAIEVKIQSKPIDSKKDIDTLFQLHQKNQACNCYLLLLNARGKRKNHSEIMEYANEKGISFIEHTSN
ncbi:MAG: hypothetical protein QNK24_03370 [Desulfuromusa sp.]|nr:hypothetical protein [Desulfuromusa sp.]